MNGTKLIKSGAWGVALALLVAAPGAWGQQGKAAKKVNLTGTVGTEASTSTLYLDNGILKVGADLSVGGAITWLSEAKRGENIINCHDWGRQVQMSFYSGPVPFVPEGKQVSEGWKQLGWNPIQVGDAFLHASQILEHRNDGKEIYVKCVPMHWPLNNVPGECTFESWIRLEGNTVKVRSRLNNARPDKTQYQGRGQELPAVYTNGPLYRLLTYTGDQPFSGGELTQIPTEKGEGFMWWHYYASENWSALVGDDNWGLGVWNPTVYTTSGGFAGLATGHGGTKDAQTGYISPVQREILDHNIVYDYEYTLIVGSLDEIRKYVYDHAQRPAPPVWRFEKDRQHWIYQNATDTGWPIKGELNISLDKAQPQLIGPATYWRAEDAPKLYVEAAFQCAPGQGHVAFMTHQPWVRDKKRGTGMKHGQPVVFDIIPDGEYHVYEIDLSSSPDYKGAVTGLTLVPGPGGQPGAWVKVRSIGLRR